MLETVSAETAAPPLPAETDGNASSTEPRLLDLAFVVASSWSVLLLANAVFLVWMVLHMLSAPRGSTPPSILEIVPMPVLLSASLVDASVTLLAAWFFVAHRRGKTFREALAIKRVSAPTLIFAIALGIATAGCATLLPSSGVSMMDKLAGKPGGIWLIAVLAVTIAPVEEIYYRGLVLPVLRRDLGWLLSLIAPSLRAAGAPLAIGIVSIWFGALHAPQLLPDVMGVLYILGIGTIWTLQRHFTGSLVPSLVSHWLHNALLMTIVIASLTAGGS